MQVMTEREKQILETFALLMPKLSDTDKSYLIGLGEGMSIKAGREPEKPQQISVRELAV